MLLKTLCLFLIIVVSRVYSEDIENFVTTEESEQAKIEAIEKEFESKGLKQIADDVSESVVLIYTISNKAKNDQQVYNIAAKKRDNPQSYKTGVISGVMLSRDGIVLTTSDGIKNSDEIIVSVNSESKDYQKDSKIILGKNDYRAKILKDIPVLNMAFLKIEPRNGRPFRHIEFGKDAFLMNGKNRVLKNGAIIIGKSRGDTYVSIEHPSNKYNMFDRYVAGAEQITYTKLKGRSALLILNSTLNTGVTFENEGGAVVGADGKLLGLASNFVDDYSAATSTAIPISVIKKGIKLAAPYLLNTDEKLSNGLILSNLSYVDNDSARQLEVVRKNLQISEKIKRFGVVVDSIEVQSLADSYGLLPEDIIIKYNDDIVTDVETFKNLEAESIGNTNNFIKVLRNKRMIDIELTL